MAATESKLNTDLTLAELLETEFVRCESCRATFANPFMLPCLHTFCEQCIVGIIAKENIDKLKENTKQNTRHFNQETDNVDCKHQTDISSIIYHRTENVNKTSNSNDQYKFDCPTCKSQITIDTSGLQEITDSTAQKHPRIDHHDNNRTSNGGANHNLEKSSSPENQSLQISTASYERLLKAIRCSLFKNHFVKSIAQLFAYRYEAGRECAYCKTEDIVEEATCLCLRCGDDVCDNCASAHRKTRITRDHSVVQYTAIQQGLFDHDIRKASHVMCEEHPESDVTHFCNDCLKVICTDCLSKHHNNHRSHRLTEAVVKLGPDIKDVQAGLSRRIPDLCQYIDFLEQQIKSLHQRQNQTTEEIRQEANRIRRMVEEWEISTISNLDSAVSQECATIMEKIHSLQMSKKSTDKMATFLRHLDNLGKADEKMGSYAPIMRRYQQLIRMRATAMTSRLVISFTPAPIQVPIGQLELEQEVFNAEDMPKSRLPISSLMPSTLKSPELIKSWTIASHHIENNNKLPQALASSYISGIDIKGNMLVVVDRNNAKVIIVDYAGQKVIKEFTGSGAHKLQKPFDVAFLPSGAIAVTDPEAPAVRVFDWTGKYLFTFDDNIQRDQRSACKCREGKKKEQHNDDRGKQSLSVRHPRGITVTKKGEAVVLDGHFRHCTVHDSNTGKLIRTIYPYRESPRKKNCKPDAHQHNPDNSYCNCKVGDSMTTSTETTGLLDVILVDPFYICTTPDKNLVITDAASPNVKILGWPNGELLQESLDYGTRQEQCLHPTGVCVDHKTGYILLVDTNNNRIHLGLPDGHFSSIIIPSSSSSSSSSFKVPAAISNGNDVKDDTKMPTDYFDNGVTKKPLSYPTCLCLDHDGHIIVAQIDGKINVYKYL